MIGKGDMKIRGYIREFGYFVFCKGSKIVLSGTTTLKSRFSIVFFPQRLGRFLQISLFVSANPVCCEGGPMSGMLVLRSEHIHSAKKPKRQER